MDMECLSSGVPGQLISSPSSRESLTQKKPRLSDDVAPSPRETVKSSSSGKEPLAQKKPRLSDDVAPSPGETEKSRLTDDDDVDQSYRDAIAESFRYLYAPPPRKKTYIPTREIKPTTCYPINKTLVKISVYTPHHMNPMMDIGFITASDGTTTTVLGRSFPLYHYKNCTETDRSLYTQDQRATVTLQSSVRYYDGSVFDATVVYIDPVLNVAVFKFKCSRLLPTAEFGSMKTLSPGQEVLSRYLCGGDFIARTRLVKEVGLGGDCGLFFHTDLEGNSPKAGVYVDPDTDGKERIIGFMMLQCLKDDAEVHGLPVDILSRILKQSENLSVDVRPSRASSYLLSSLLDKDTNVCSMLRLILSGMDGMQKQIQELTCSGAQPSSIDVIDKLQDKVSMLPELASMLQKMKADMDLMSYQIKTIIDSNAQEQDP